MNHMISSVYLPLLPHPRLRRPCRSGYPSGAANGGRLLFGNFFLAMQEKVTSRRSATGEFIFLFLRTELELQRGRAKRDFVEIIPQILYRAFRPHTCATVYIVNDVSGLRKWLRHSARTFGNSLSLKSPSLTTVPRKDSMIDGR